MTPDFPAIVCTEPTLGGSPRLAGRRLAVGEVVSTLHYNSLAEALSDYELSRWQVKQALHYCAVRQCVADKPAVFCHNCSLDSQRNKSLSWSDLEEVKTESGVMVKGNGLVFFGTMAEFLADWHGADWWVAARDLLIDLRNDLLENE